MAARVITITSGKGGVGKTTATANLGVALASLGYKVTCIDADIGLRNLDVVMGLENRIVYNIVDVVEGRARLRQAMIKDKRLKEDLYLIPAAQTRDKTAISPSDMVRVCDELRELVDFILVDSPAGIERGFRNAIAPADDVIIVTNPEVSSVRDADRIIGLIEAENKGPGKLVLNRIKAEMVKRGDMLSPDDVIDVLAIKLLGIIPEDENILVSSNRGVPVALGLSDDTPAGKAFLNIARRITGEDVPFLPLEDDSGFMQKLARGLGFSFGGSSQKSSPPQRREESKEAPPKAEKKTEPVEKKPEPALKPVPAKEATKPVAEEKIEAKVEKAEVKEPAPKKMEPAAAKPVKAKKPVEKPAPVTEKPETPVAKAPEADKEKAEEKAKAVDDKAAELAAKAAELERLQKELERQKAELEAAKARDTKENVDTKQDGSNAPSKVKSEVDSGKTA